VDTTTGFSDVDGSERACELVDYLRQTAETLVAHRRQGYARLALAPGSAALDIGCGAGEVCVELAARVAPGGRVVGIDPSAAMIEAARKAAATAAAAVELGVASVYALPFPDATFDAVRAERVLQHLERPEDALAEMIRVTRPGGRVWASDPDHGQLGLALDDPIHRRTYAVLHRAFRAMVVNPHSGTRLRGMFARAGLADVEQHVQAISIEFDDYARALFLRSCIDGAVASGEIGRADADAFLAELAARHRAGTFDANAIAYEVVGTRV
jgi:ubiquinone/menaquinone biosynthesis C-methylase UbiE